MSYGQGGQGGPPWGSGGSQTPDWSALAADAERRRNQRRWWVIGGSVLAAAAVGTVVALAIVSGSGGDSEVSSSALPDPQDLPPDTSQPEPTFEETTLQPLPEPREFISNPAMDTASFTADDFFAGDTMEIESRGYSEVATRGTRDCASAVTQDLGTVLERNRCATLLRATYTSDGVAVTVGVAQFATEADAQAARDAAVNNDAAVSNLLPLTAGDAPDFCQRGGCRTTTNQVGRYAYFTMAGNSDGSPDEGENTPARQAALDGNDQAFGLIIQRGEAQASASASELVEERENED